MSFRAHLETAFVPPLLGDARLRLDQSWLFIEGVRRAPSLGPTAWLACASSAAVVAVVLLLSEATGERAGWAALLTGAAAACAALAAKQEHRRRATRRFALNFETHRIRLDTPAPFRGLPGTLWVAFDQVRDLSIIPTADGRQALILEFVPGVDPHRVLREVLVARLTAQEDEAARRLERLLRQAIGLTPA